MTQFRVHERVHPPIGGKSMTKQAHKDEADINNILRKHEKGLVVDHLNLHQGQYGDFIDAPDYHTALNRINDANTAFMSVPAEIRARFSNDAAQFLNFVQDPENLAEMREMGLAHPERPEALPDAPRSDPPADPSITVPAETPLNPNPANPE